METTTKEYFLQYMATLYDQIATFGNEIPEYIRHNIKMSIIDNDSRLYYLVVDRRTSDRIEKWVNHYDKGQKA